MPPVPAPDLTEPQAASRCTRAIARFVQRLPQDEEDIDPMVAYALINLVQGRVLEYLAERIARLYRISDAGTHTRIERQLLSIFSEEFFALFRARVEDSPTLVLHIARRIIEKECESVDCPCSQASVDRMYSAIFRKYFKYRHLGALLNIVAGDARIQRTIIHRLVEQHSCRAADAERVDAQLADDPEGIVPALMLPYFRQDRAQELFRDLESDDWRQRRRLLTERIACLRGA